MILTSISLFPLRTVLFSDGILPLQIFEVRYLNMINKCIANGTQFCVVSLTQGSEVRQLGVTETLATAGTLARINSWHAPLPGLLQIICTGTMRFHVASSKQLKHGLWVAEVVQIENGQAISIPDELQDTADALRPPRITPFFNNLGVTTIFSGLAGAQFMAKSRSWVQIRIEFR